MVCACAGLWPDEDILRLFQHLGAQNLQPLVIASRAYHRELQVPFEALRRAKADPANHMHVELQEALRQLELAMEEASEASEAKSDLTSQGSWTAVSQTLLSLEESLHTEMRYAYGPDWEMKPGKLVSKKGTWLKPNTKFSWELTEGDKLYLPQGIVMPVLQIGKVSSPEELRRHDWVGQHLLVWMKPSIVRSLEGRRNVWFVYWPHFEHEGLSIVATSDTWLKRTTQMSSELQPFELVYVPKGMPVRLSQAPSLVDEEWEMYRHHHVHLHRKVVLAGPPVTVKQDQYDIFIGQGDSQLNFARVVR